MSQESQPSEKNIPNNIKRNYGASSNDPAEILHRDTYFKLPVKSRNETSSVFKESSGYSTMDAYQRHQQLITQYLSYTPSARDGRASSGDIFNTLTNSSTSKGKRDIDVLKQHHQFLRDDHSTNANETPWEVRLAQKYYSQLFKEYAITDLSRYKEFKVALRWRVKEEVISGKGQFICGSSNCDSRLNLHSWEVNFGYVEGGIKKNALVKLRLCPSCSYKLNYKKMKEQKKLQKSKKRKSTKHKKKKSKSDINGDLENVSSNDSESDDASQGKADNAPSTDEEFNSFVHNLL